MHSQFRHIESFIKGDSFKKKQVDKDLLYLGLFKWMRELLKYRQWKVKGNF